MLFFSGPGLSGLLCAREASQLPAEMRAMCAGMSGGALCALATSLGDASAVLRAVDSAAWPGSPSRLAAALDSECTLGLTFETWHLRGAGALPFCVVAWSSALHKPVVLSPATTPTVAVSAAVAGAASWPGASTEQPPSQLNDAEFFLSPLDVFSALRPPRALAVVVEQPRLKSLAGRLADYHGLFMASLSRPNVGMVLRLSGPHMADSILWRAGARSALEAAPKRRLARLLGAALALASVLVLLAQLARKKDASAGGGRDAPARRASARALKRKERRRARRMRQASAWKGSVEGPVGQEPPVTGRRPRESSSGRKIEMHGQAVVALDGAAEVAAVA